VNTIRERAASKTVAAVPPAGRVVVNNGAGIGGAAPPAGGVGAPSTDAAARRVSRPSMPPKLDECKAFILRELIEAGGVMPMHMLDAAARAQDYSFAAIKWAKRTLKDEGRIRHLQRKINGADVWHTRLLPPTTDTKK